MDAHCLKLSADMGVSAEQPYYFQHVVNRRLSRIEHAHEFYEIYIFLRGNARHMIAGGRFSHQKDDVVWILPGEPHVFTGDSEEIELFCLSVLPEEISRFMNAYGVSDLAFEGQKRCCTLDSRQIQEIRALLSRRLAPSHTNRAECFRIVVGMIVQAYLKRQALNANEWETNIFEKMNSAENLAEGVSALLRITHLSHAQLCRVIKSQMNMTPQQYIKEMRLNYAFDLIQSTNKSYEDIALTVGYSSFSHFCMSFKTNFGISPAELRKKRWLV